MPLLSFGFEAFCLLFAIVVGFSPPSLFSQKPVLFSFSFRQKTHIWKLPEGLISSIYHHIQIN